jgi:hypothetical protein
MYTTDDFTWAKKLGSSEGDTNLHLEHSKNFVVTGKTSCGLKMYTAKDLQISTKVILEDKIGSKKKPVNEIFNLDFDYNEHTIE